MNDAVSDAGKTVPLLLTVLDLVHKLLLHIHNSGKRSDIFTDVKLEFSQRQSDDTVESVDTCSTYSGGSLRPLCPTRWTVRASAIKSVVINYEQLIETLERIQSDKNMPVETASTAGGLLKQMMMSETYFRCVMAGRLFTLTDAFATSIQIVSIHIDEILRRKKDLLSELDALRSQFDILFDNALAEATRMDLDVMQLPRRRRVPARIDSMPGTQVDFADVRSMHRAQFFEAVDTIRSTVDWRLDEGSLQPATCLQRVLTNAASNGIIDGALLSSVEQFHPHLNLSQLKSELGLISQRHIEPSISGMVALL